jgi:thiol-disulfide isomerase/thioredoxin
MHSGTWRVAAALLALVVGVWAGLRLHSHTAPPVSGVRVPAGEASPPIPSDLDKPWDPAEPPRVTIPEKLPEFALGDRTGKRTSISTWQGKSLIINFWATWCAPCRHEIPLLESLSQNWQSRNVQVVGVAVDYRDKVLAYANDLKIPYPLLIGEQDALDAATALGMDSPVFPFTVFTDRRGQIVTLFVGELHKPQADLILSVVQNVNEDRIPLTTARHNIADGLRALAPNPSG